MSNFLGDYFYARTIFSHLFREMGENLIEMSELLVSGLTADSISEREASFTQIDMLEKKGDNSTHRIYLALEKTYFAPVNRKYIHVLASLMDDIADQIQETTSRIKLYTVEVIDTPTNDMAANILKAVIEIEKLTFALFDIKNVDEMFISCKQIKHYEHLTDLIYYRALSDLFATEKDPITLLKHKDILYSLETAANKCKSTADTIYAILLDKI